MTEEESISLIGEAWHVAWWGETLSSNIKEVQLFKDDFRVIHFALLECQTAWRNMIDADDLPDLPNMDMGRAHHILTRFAEVDEKVRVILDGEPLKVGEESLRKIREIIGGGE